MYLHQRLQIDTQALVNQFAEHQIDILRGAKVEGYTLDMSAVIAGNLYEEGCKLLPAVVMPLVQGRQRQLKTTLDSMQTEYQKLHTRYSRYTNLTLDRNNIYFITSSSQNNSRKKSLLNASFVFFFSLPSEFFQV